LLIIASAILIVSQYTEGCTLFVDSADGIYSYNADTVLDLKDKIYVRRDIDMDIQHIFFEGAELSDYTLLKGFCVSAKYSINQKVKYLRLEIYEGEL